MIHLPSQRGIATTAIVIMAAIALIGAGTAYYFSNRTGSKTQQRTEEKKMMEEKEAMMQKDTVMMKDTSPNPAAGDTMMKKEEGATVKYTGTVLAGTSAPLLDFNQADFDTAVKSNKLIVLYFFANWCPICAQEFPKAQAAFNQLTTDQVVGFRVNFNDNQTDDDEETLARTHGVAYQHTKVLVKNGQQILKSPETWEQSRYVTEITKALPQ